MRVMVGGGGVVGRSGARQGRKEKKEYKKRSVPPRIKARPMYESSSIKVPGLAFSLLELTRRVLRIWRATLA